MQHPDYGDEGRRTPALTVLDGQGMSADDAAWTTVAEATERALATPGLSTASASELRALLAASLRCARSDKR